MPTLPVLGTTLHHRESGDPEGLPFVFLHGNPTSSHLWRNVLPAVAAPGRRLLAPDLVGMGDSGKPDLAYSFDDHARHLDAWFDALGITEAVLVGHDWGGTLAFDRAARLPDRVRGLAFTETIVKPLYGDEFPPAGRQLFELLRTPGVGEEMVLEKSMFVEGLPATLATTLDPADLEVYRRAFPTPRSRRPVLEWARMMPLDGEPADIVARIEHFDAWLATSPEVPKLLVAFEPGPGAMTDRGAVAWCEENIAGLEVSRNGLAGHHSPEDRPVELAAAINTWADHHGLTRA
ncbi:MULTISPECIES: haloalkane dehalogenase [unclassified Streptomyces]|uniref:haloalkane dehalogenase n=1 Tax=unclassified Streptomyces TaxID=2593676 RepID=UPI0001C18AD8|nr:MULTISPECIES: haloalkane dehalogenase [unclassified Streptomyces]MYR69451.1 haloalkane dehalogenase [Streptomyces sp. SID4939]MYS01210.1 haloalkane dehalogenase [Streptomyces sp. SID4940]MYT66335.1 haloalkane dehalogenase [Streptomyces sp. SID8357]MYT83255.1 haloalkane dehalogenase [Streptomyces sp. SID8360]MYW36012.1 haloalkane dehalogenase [Streptomyces sp. SID1]